MKYLLDTDTLSWLIGMEPPRALLRRSRSIPPADQAVSIISVAEMLRGAHREGARTGELLDRIENGVIQRFDVLPFDMEAAHRYGPLQAHLESRGAPIGMGDTLIAATALAYGLIVVTGNVRHFQRVPGLEVEDWLA